MLWKYWYEGQHAGCFLVQHLQLRLTDSNVQPTVEFIYRTDRHELMQVTAMPFVNPPSSPARFLTVELYLTCILLICVRIAVC